MDGTQVGGPIDNAVGSPLRMDDRQRILIGAMGGLLVAVIAYPLPAYETIFPLDNAIPELIGWLIRAAGFSFLGGLWAYLHASEHDRMKAFQLGIIGPAVISAMISANFSPEKLNSTATTTRFDLSIISSAHAAEDVIHQRKPSSFLDRVIKSLLGTQRKRG